MFFMSTVRENTGGVFYDTAHHMTKQAKGYAVEGGVFLSLSKYMGVHVGDRYNSKREGGGVGALRNFSHLPSEARLLMQDTLLSLYQSMKLTKTALPRFVSRQEILTGCVWDVRIGAYKFVIKSGEAKDWRNPRAYGGRLFDGSKFISSNYKTPKDYLHANDVICENIVKSVNNPLTCAKTLLRSIYGPDNVWLLRYTYDGKASVEYVNVDNRIARVTKVSAYHDTKEVKIIFDGVCEVTCRPHSSKGKETKMVSIQITN
jgi:hypothetical protein